MSNLIMLVNSCDDFCFIKDELKYSAAAFGQVSLIVLSEYKQEYDNFLPKIPNLTIFYTGKQLLTTTVSASVVLKTLCNPFLYKEIVLILKKKGSKIRKIKDALTFMYYGIAYSRLIKKYLPENTDKTLIYSYWFTSIALAAVLIKKKYPEIKILTRTHGYDLYEFRNILQYQPYKKYMDQHLDKIVFACRQGFEYYQKTFAASDTEKYEVHRLGIKNTRPLHLEHPDTRVLQLISCSYMVEVKRIHLIIEALSLLLIPTTWTHIGSGPLEKNLKNMTKNILSAKKNITYTFIPSLTNIQVMEQYATHYYDCFISTTESEGGCPVSMQECMSFGIPVIATAVGGIPEIVDKTNGVLISEPCVATDFAEAIVRFAKSSDEQKKTMRNNAYKTWETQFNAEKNFPKFTDMLKALLEKK